MWCTSTQPASARRPETRWRFHLSRGPGFGVHFSPWRRQDRRRKWFGRFGGTPAGGSWPKRRFGSCWRGSAGKRASRRSAAAKAWRRISITAGAKNSLRPARSRLLGDTTREATSTEVQDLRRENSQLKQVVAEAVLENRVLKKIWWSPVRGTIRATDRGREARDHPACGGLGSVGAPYAAGAWGFTGPRSTRGIAATRPWARPGWSPGRRPPGATGTVSRCGVRHRVVEAALADPVKSPRELAWQFTDRERHFLSESSVYRILKSRGSDHQSGVCGALGGQDICSSDAPAQRVCGKPTSPTCRWYCQVDEKLGDRPTRYWARARREPAMLGIGNARQPQLDNTPPDQQEVGGVRGSRARRDR